MNEERWFAVLLVVVLVIATALFHYMAVSFGIQDLHWKVERDNRTLRNEIDGLRRDIGRLKRENEFRAEQDDRDVERILYEVRRSR